MRFGSRLAHVIWTSKHRRRCLVRYLILNHLTLIQSMYFSDLIFRGICLFLDWWNWCQIRLLVHHLHRLSIWEASRTMARNIIDEILLLQDILGKQFGIDLAYGGLGRLALITSDWRHLLSSRAISLRFDSDNFWQWLNCLASNLGERSNLLFHTIDFMETLLCSNWVTQNGLARRA